MNKHELTHHLVDARNRHSVRRRLKANRPLTASAPMAAVCKTIAAALLSASVIIVAGCAASSEREYITDDPKLDRSLRVALIPFENLTSYPQAGLIMAELLSTELYGRRVFNLMESTELRRALTERKIDTAELARSTVAAELASALNVDAVIIGSVSEFSYQHGLHEEPTVGANARLVTADGGEVLWAASYSDTGRGLLRRDSLNEAAQRVVERMASALDRRLDSSG